MAIWAFDGWPVVRLVSNLLGGLDLFRTAPGYGPDIAYSDGQTFWDDDLNQTISGTLAKQRAPTIDLDAYVKEPYGPWPAVVIEPSIDEVGWAIEDAARYRPPQVPPPNLSGRPVPTIGDVLVVVTGGPTPPGSITRTAAGGYILPPAAAESVTTTYTLDADTKSELDGVHDLLAEIRSDIPTFYVDKFNALVANLQGGRDDVTYQVLPLLRTILAQVQTPAAPNLVPVLNQLAGMTTTLNSVSDEVYHQIAPLLATMNARIGQLATPDLGPITSELTTVLTAVTNLAARIPPDPTAALNAIRQQIAAINPGLTTQQAAQLAGIDQVTGEIESTVSGISSSIQSKLDVQAATIEGRLSQVADNVTQRLGADVQQAENVVTAAAAQITTDLGHQTAAVEQTVQQSANAITAQIGGQIDQLAGGLDAAFATGTAAIADAVGRVADDVAGLKPDPAEWLSALLSFGQGVWPSWAEPLKILVEHAVRGTMDSLEGDADQLVAQLLGTITVGADAPPVARAIVAQLTSGAHAIGLVGKIAILGFLVGEVAGGLFRQPIEFFTQLGNRTDPREIPSLAETSALRARGLVDVALGRELAARKGFAQTWADLSAELDRELLSPAEVVAAWLRGYLTEDDAVAQLERRGMNETDARTLMRLATEVPTPGDLVTFMRREVFTPTISEPYGHFEEYPAGATPWFAKVGFDEQVAKLYWAAHWDVPSATQFFEMFQRGIIDRDALMLGLRAANIVPGWRDKLVQLTYHPITRVDLRRFYQLGVINVEELPRRYQDLGYSPENAQLAADWTVKYAKHTNNAELAAFRNPIRTRLLTAYLDETLTETEVRAGLAEIGYTPDDVGEFFAEATRLLTAATRKSLRDDYRKLYVDGDLDGEQVRGRLTAQGLLDGTIDRWLTAWAPERELTADRELRRHHKTLSRAEVVEGYRDGLETRDVALAELVDLGYSADASAQLLALEDARLDRAVRRDEIDAVHVQYTRGLVDRATASANLDALQVPPRQRQAYLRRWDAERTKAPPALSHAELRDLYVRGLVSRDVALAQLVATHLAAADAQLLVSSWDAQRQHTIENLTDAELKRLLAAGLIGDAEVRSVLQLRGLSADVAARLASVVGA